MKRRSTWLSDTMLITGLIILSAGIALIHVPAGVIAFGAGIIALGVLRGLSE